MGGLVTEPKYFGWLQRRLKGVSLALVAQGRDPLDLVKRAIDAASDDKRASRNARDSANTFDDVWVVTDVDQFSEAIPGARQEAKRHGVSVAVSNPCFEVWLLMHGECGGGVMTADQAQKAALRQGLLDSAKPKVPRCEQLVGRFAVAEKRAAELRSVHKAARHEFPDDNPSTEIDLLVRRCLSLAADSASEHRGGL